MSVVSPEEFRRSLSLAITHLGMSWGTLVDPVVRRSQRSFLPASEVMAPTDFNWNHERRGQQSLSWSETPRLSVGLRVQVRRRVAGDDPRTDHNNDGKGGEKSGSSASRKLSWLSRWLSFCVVVRLCVWVLVLCLFGLSWCWELGVGLGCPFPLWLAAAPVFLVPAPVLVFREKGRRPKNRSRRSFARAGPFQVIPGMFGSTGASISRAYSFAGTYRGLFLLLLTASSLSGKASPRAFNPPSGASGRTSSCRAGSPWSFAFPSMSLSSLLLCFHCGVPCLPLQVCFLLAPFLKLQSPWVCGPPRLSCCFPPVVEVLALGPRLKVFRGGICSFYSSPLVDRL